MVKEPRPGTVKARLAEGIGAVPAAAWYRRCSLRVIRRVTDPRWQTFLAVTPDISADTGAFWPFQVPRIPQGGGDLGDRMGRIFKTLPPGPAVIIGSDIPDVTAGGILRAFRLLDGHGAVFGPSPDGGYWLVGLGRHRRNSAGMFKNVRWSGRHALADSVKSLGGVSVRFAETLADVDTSGDI